MKHYIQRETLYDFFLINCFIHNNDLEYSDEDNKIKKNKKDKKVRKAYAEKKEDIKKFIYNKSKESI